MPKKKEQTLEDASIKSEDIQIDSTPSSKIKIDLGEKEVSPLKQKKSIKGEIVSINLKLQTFFGVNIIWLTPTRYWARVPENINEAEEKIINNAIRSGHLILGKKYMPPIDRNSKVKDSYRNLIQNTVGVTLDDNSSRKILELVRKEKEGGWTASEIINHCIESEKEKRNRPKILQFLREAVSMYNGPETLVPSYSEEEGIRDKNTIRN